MTNLHVFYNPNQSVSSNKSFSPSAGKPEHVVRMFLENPRVKVVGDWNPLTPDQMSIAHDTKFVNDVLNGVRKNGFGNTSPAVANSLGYTTGSFFNAALFALENNTVAMSPTSGFHHSHYDNCHGFCTFNGLMIAAFLLWRDHNISRVGIIDFDAHYGDGTENIIKTFKGARKVVEHLTFGGLELRGTDFNKWLDGLEATLVRQFRDCDILFYQAGADPHIDDPLGGYLTTEQMKRRDEIVFKVAKALKKPIVWNLAGGYQDPLQKVLDLHKNTLNACLQNYL